MTTFCRKYIKTAWAMTGHKEAIFTRMRCGSWDCEACAQMNRAAWVKHLNKRLPEVSETWFLLTITARGDTRGHIESFTSIRDNIDRLIKRVRVVFGKPVEYVRVFEKHPKSAAVHAHLVMSGLTPFVQNGFSVKHRPVSVGVINRRSRWGCWSLRTWMKKSCSECGMGFIIDVREIPVSVAVRYVTKYLTKHLQGIAVKGLRHVQTTTGIGSPKPQETDLSWDVGAYMTTYSTPAGTRVTDINTGRVIDNQFWETCGFYPNED